MSTPPEELYGLIGFVLLIAIFFARCEDFVARTSCPCARLGCPCHLVAAAGRANVASHVILDNSAHCKGGAEIEVNAPPPAIKGSSLSFQQFGADVFEHKGGALDSHFA